MKEISLENLNRFLNLFEVADETKHIVIVSTIRSFIQRFEKFPELKAHAKLFALTEDWESDGIFFMTFHTTEFESNIHFDTINDENREIIKNALKTFYFSKTTFFFSIRNEFRPTIIELYKELNLNMIEDTDTICLRLSKEKALKFEISPLENFELKPLTLENIEKINSIWPHRYEGSDKFLEYTIKYHLSVGLFDADKNLVAWCMRYDNGSLGILQVEEKLLRKGFGSLLVKKISKEIVETFDCDVISLVLHTNLKSINLFKKLGFEENSRHTCFGMIAKK